MKKRFRAHEAFTEDWMLRYVNPEPNSGCWLWSARRDDDGYGRITATVHKSRLAHRAFYERFVGPADGLYVLHKCDNPACVNPEHLFLGDQLANMADCKAKGRIRTQHGDRHTSAKLNFQIVAEIRERYARGDISQQALADEYGVNQTAISRAVSGRGWRQAS
jgi:hypothetical protein